VTKSQSDFSVTSFQKSASRIEKIGHKYDGQENEINNTFFLSQKFLLE
jgi:hypothetical protein